MPIRAVRPKASILAEDLADRLKGVSLVLQPRNQSLNGKKSLSDVGIGADISSVMQANNTARRRPPPNQIEDFVRGPFPVVSNNRPHDAEQAESALRLADAIPTQSKRSAQEFRLYLRFGLNDGLSKKEFVQDELRRSHLNSRREGWTEPRVGISMVADLVSSFADLPANPGMPQNVRPTLEECRFDALLAEVVEKIERAWAGTIVEGKRD